jgi:transcriptional regulator with XRE-family HTH domain
MQEIFSKRLREIRTSMRYSQPQLAEIINSSKQAINNWEHERGLPALDLAARLADALGVSLDYLAGRTDNPRVARSRKPEKP